MNPKKVKKDTKSLECSDRLDELNPVCFDDLIGAVRENKIKDLNLLLNIFREERRSVNQYRRSVLNFLKEREDQYDYVQRVFLMHDYAPNGEQKAADFPYIGAFYDEVVYKYHVRNGERIFATYMRDYTTQGTMFVFGKKNLPRAINSRMLGNFAFALGRLEMAMHQYSMAILFAPRIEGDVIIHSYSPDSMKPWAFAYGVVDSGTLDPNNAAISSDNTPKQSEMAALKQNAHTKPKGRNKKNANYYAKQSCHHSKDAPKIATPVAVHMSHQEIKTADGKAFWPCREFILAYNNRSVVLFERGDYYECLNDIEVAIAGGIEKCAPLSTIHEMNKRKLVCLIELKQAVQAKQFYDQICDKWPLEELSLLVNHNDRIEQLLLKRSSLKSDVRTPECERNFDHYDYTKLAGFPALSSKLDFAFNGYEKPNIIAKEDIIPGDIVMVDVPLASTFGRYYSTFYCNYCLRSFRNSPKRKQSNHFQPYVPCLRCSNVVYCSPSCSVEHWKTHRYECNYYVLLHESPAIALAYNVVIKAGLRTVFKSFIAQATRANNPWRKHFRKLPSVQDSDWLPSECAQHKADYNNLTSCYLYTCDDKDDEASIRRNGYYAALLLHIAEHSGWLKEQLQLNFGSHFCDLVPRKEWKQFLAGIFYMHITQIQYMAIKAIEPPKMNTLSEGANVIALGVYANANMFQQSCVQSANTTRYFDGDIMVVKAKHKIKAGQPVLLYFCDFSSPQSLRAVSRCADILSSESGACPATVDVFHYCPCATCHVHRKRWERFVHVFERSCQSQLPLVQVKDFRKPYLSLACNLCSDLIVFQSSAQACWQCRGCAKRFEDVPFARMLVLQDELLKEFEEQCIKCFNDINRSLKTLINRDSLRSILKIVEKIEALCYRDSHWLVHVYGYVYELTNEAHLYRKAAVYLERRQAIQQRTIGPIHESSLLYHIRLAELKFRSTLLVEKTDRIKTIVADFLLHCKNTFLCLSQFGSDSPDDYFSSVKRELLTMISHLEDRRRMGQVTLIWQLESGTSHDGVPVILPPVSSLEPKIADQDYILEKHIERML